MTQKIRDFPNSPDVVCVNCGNPECCWCHLPYHDAGWGQKCDDMFGFIGCQECHDYADGRAKADRTGHSHPDGGRLDYEWRYRVLRHSQLLLLKAGLIKHG